MTSMTPKLAWLTAVFWCIEVSCQRYFAFLLNGYQISRCHSIWKDRRIIVAPVGLVLIGTGMMLIFPCLYLLEPLLTMQLSDKFCLVSRGSAWRQAVSRQLHHICGWESFCDFCNRHVFHHMPVTLFLTINFAPATGMIWTSRKVRNIVKLDLNMVAGYITSLL